MNKANKNKFVIAVAVSVLIMASLVAFVLISRNESNRKIISTYTACGCACGGGPTEKTQYYSKSHGEEDAYNQAIKNDEEAVKQCNPLAGCSNTGCTKLILVE